MKKIGILLLLIFIGKYGFTQFDPTNDHEGMTLQQIIDLYQPYYDSLKNNVPDSILTAEGSEYNYWRKYKEFWEPKLSPFNGDFEKYYQMELQYIKAHPRNNNNHANSDPWYEIGPKKSTLDKSFATIGPIEFIDFYENDPTHMICGSTKGGVFYSNNNGDDWHVVSDDWYYPATSSAVFNSNNPSVFYATSQNPGENEANSIGYLGGVMKCSNYGNTFEIIGNFNDFDGIWTKIFKLQNDANNENILYAATSKGLYKCNDINNATPNNGYWTQLNVPVPQSILVANPNYAFNNKGSHFDFEIDPGNSNHLYTTVKYQLSNGSSTIYRWAIMQSFDGGSSWEEIQIPASETHNDIITIEVTPADPSLLYVLFLSSKSKAYRFNYNDNSFSSNLTWIETQNSTQNNPIYINPTKIYPSYGRGNTFCASPFDGNKFTVGTSTTAKNFNFLDINNPDNINGFHSDLEDVIYHPTNPNEIWVASHGGAEVSYDNGLTWQPKTNGLALSDVFRMSTSYQDPGQILLGIYHDYSQLSSTPYDNNWNTDWKYCSDGDGTACKINPVNKNFMWSSAQFGGKPLYKSNDNGATFFSNGSTGGWESVIEMNENEHLYFNKYNGNSSDLYVSFDNNSTNYKISDFNQFLQGNYFVYKIALTSDPNTVYVLVYEKSSNGTINHLFRTQNATNIYNVQWELLPQPKQQLWGTIQADLNNPNILYLGYPDTYSPQVALQGTDMLYKVNYTNPNNIDCTNGVNCTNMTYNLIHSTVTAIALEKGTDEGVYVATNWGVFFTNNKLIQNGNNWIPVGEYPYVSVSDLEINYKINKIRIGTRGRGVWEHDLICPDCFDNTITSDHMQNDFIECQNNINSNVIVYPSVNVTYRAGNEINLTPGFYSLNQSNFHAFIHPCNQPGNSFKTNGNNQNNFEYNDNTTLNTNHFQNEESRLNIYPNPAQNTVLIELNNLTSSNYKIKLVTLTGKTVFNTTTNQTIYQINTSKFERGMYMVVIYTDNKILTQKLILQ